MKSSYSDIEENSPLDKIYIPGQLVFYSEADLIEADYVLLSEEDVEKEISADMA